MKAIRKKLAVFALVLVLLLSGLCLAACKKADMEIDVDIYFSRDVAGKDVFGPGVNVFEVGEEVYIHVGFSIVKNVKEAAVFQFEVEVPYVDYYTTLALQSGVFKNDGETSNPWTRQDADGNEYNGRTLTLMPYTLEEKETPLPYVFRIEANRACTDVDFLIKIVQSGISVSVGGEKTNEYKITYSFIAGDENE